MGQRLVITIEKGNETICSVYQHWSGYTLSAAETLKDLCKVINPDDSKEKTILSILRFLEKQGGGIDGGKGSDEWKVFEKMFPEESFFENPNRNSGLIDITEEGISNSLCWADETASINIDQRQVYNGTFWCDDDDEDDNDEYDDDEDDDNEDDDDEYDDDEYDDDELPKAKINVSQYSMNRADEVVNELDRLSTEGSVFVNVGGSILEFVE